MGRPRRLPESDRISMVLPRKYVQKLDEIASRRQISRSAVLRQLLARAFPEERDD